MRLAKGPPAHHHLKPSAMDARGQLTRQYSARTGEELRKMKMSELQKRARACGVSSDRVDDAADAADPKADLIGLITSAFAATADRMRAELGQLKMSQLQKRARAAGADGEKVDDAADATDPKAELIELIVECELLAGKPPEAVTPDSRVERHGGGGGGGAQLSAMLVPRPSTSEAFSHADSLLRSSWAKSEQYTFVRLVEVQEIHNPGLLAKYAAYKLTMPPDAINGNEQLLFHGCANAAIESIAERGFLRAFQTSAAGQWQRFGAGFYFALQASKSHEYPIAEMAALPAGQVSRVQPHAHARTMSAYPVLRPSPILCSDSRSCMQHFRKMILCKVAKGKVLVTAANMDSLAGAAPAGYNSVHGQASAAGPMNFDELVVYEEAAILPYAVVTYEFTKVGGQQPGMRASSEGPPSPGSPGSPTGGVTTVDELVAASGARRDELLSFSKDDLVELLKELGVGVVVRNRLLKEVVTAVNVRMLELARSQDFAAVVDAVMTFRGCSADEDTADSYSKLTPQRETLITAARAELKRLARQSSKPTELIGATQ